MLKIQNTRQIILGFILVAVVFFFYSDRITEWIVNFHNPIIILLLATLLNPVYILFIWSLFDSYGWRGACAGLLISISADLISIPHIYTKVGVLSKESYQLISDSTFWNLIPSFLKFNIDGFNFGIFLVYVIVSSLLVILALMIVHRRNFKSIFLKSV